MTHHYRANADPHPPLFTGMMEETWPNQHRTGSHVEEIFAAAAEATAGWQNSAALAFEVIRSSLGEPACTQNLRHGHTGDEARRLANAFEQGHDRTKRTSPGAGAAANRP